MHLIFEKKNKKKHEVWLLQPQSLQFQYTVYQSLNPVLIKKKSRFTEVQSIKLTQG